MKNLYFIWRCLVMGLGMLLPALLAAQTYQINFSDGTPPPVGWETDDALPYGIRSNGLTYGWVVPGTQTPVSMASEARNRAPSPDVDVLTETLIHMRRADVTAGATNGDWQIALPNGIYSVTITVGDLPGGGTNNIHSIEAEGEQIVFWDQQSEGVFGFRTGTGTVNLQDGILTLDASSGFNTKVANVVIALLPTIQINFSEGTPPPSGWETDEGLGYGPRPNGFTYGWVEPGTQTPVDMTAETRNRPPSPDVNVLTETLCHMRRGDVSGTATDGDWQIALPNGSYFVAVQVGDAANNDSRHVIRAEGNVLIDYDSNGDPTPTLAQGGCAVEVTDGILNLDAVGGTNTKIMTVVIEPRLPLRRFINFSDAATPAPAGYIRDEGLGYVAQGDLTYGWIDPISGTPVSLETRARNRTPDPDVDVFRETFNHMLYSDVTAGSQDGTWEMEIPNGTYRVSLQLGSVNFENNVASVHHVRAEGITLLDYTVPLGELGVRNGTGEVTVTDGRLTLDADLGTNTKLHAVIIEDACGTQTPLILGTTPLDGETDVFLNPTISANDIFLPNAGPLGATSIDNSTITGATVQLFEIAGPTSANGTQVSATVNGTGGGDAINLTPNANLNPNSWYRVVINGVRDLAGEFVMPYSFVFQTGTDTDTGTGTGDLSQVAFSNEGAVKTGERYTTLTIGPDGLLYGLTISGEIFRWTMNVDGTLANEEILTDWMIPYSGSRTAIGLVFDPTATASNLVAYVSHCSSGLNSAPEWDGRISRISGPTLGTEELLVTNLPRSIRDHLTNSIVFDPVNPNLMYFLQGSNSAGGAPDGAWGNRPERLLSAACLRLDLSLLPPSLPLDAQTSMTQSVINAADANSPTMSDGSYNPYFVNAPLTLYATGVRNAYDLVWHSNGQLYIPTNGTAGGSNSPASVDGTLRPDGTVYNSTLPEFSVVPALNGNQTQRDWLFRVDPNSGIGYYGHPNPLRGEYALNRGNPDESDYPVSMLPDPNYRGAAFDFQFNISPNGVIEYRSTAHGGNLQGAILVCRYSGGSDIIALLPDGPDGDIATSRIGITGFTGFQDPLDLIENPSNGNIYVSDYARNEIVLLRPVNPPTGEAVLTVSPDSLIIDENVGSTSPAFPITLTNTGDVAINGLTLTLGGVDGGEFALSTTTIPTLAPNTPVTVDVFLSPTTAGPKIADITLAAAGISPQTITLRGLGKSGEPSLQWILDAYLGPGLIDVGDDDPSTNIIHSDPASYTAPRLGDEIGQTLFRHSDLTTPVTVEIVSVYGPTSADPIVALAWYEMNDLANFQEFFTLTNSPASNGQSLNFSVDRNYSFNPTSEEFGFFSRWPFFGNRILYSEDALNTFSGSIPHHVRVYDLPGEENAYVVATEEHTSGFDFQDIVFIVRNVELTGGEMDIANTTRLPGLDIGFPAEDWYVFQRINDPVRGGNTYSFDDTATMRISNPGMRPLVITELNISDATEYTLPNGEDAALPLVIEPGQFYDLLMQFIETEGAKGTRIRSMEIVSNAGRDTVTLAGGYQLAPEGGNEITFRNMLDLFGYTTRVPTTLPWDGEYPTAADLADPAFPYGEDIVVSELWEQADPNQAVTGMFLYAQFGIGEFPIDISALDPGGSVVGGYTFRAASTLPDGSTQAQRLFAKTRLPGNNYNENAALSMSGIPGPFRIGIGQRNTAGNGNITPNGTPRYLGVRLFRVRDLDGNIVPDAFIGTLDLTPGNHDFNDVMVYFQNIQPASSVTFPVELLSFEATNLAEAVALDWETESEENTERFRVLRSADGATFEEIGTLAAAGNSQKRLKYQLLDTQPLEGRSFYQLETVDLDGATSLSSVVEVFRQNDQLVSRFYPNPADNVLNLALGIQGDSDATVMLSCFNATGQQVLQQTQSLSAEKLSIDTSPLPNGMYVLMITLSTGQRARINFLVQH